MGRWGQARSHLGDAQLEMPTGCQEGRASAPRAQRWFLAADVNLGVIGLDWCGRDEVWTEIAHPRTAEVSEARGRTAKALRRAREGRRRSREGGCREQSVVAGSDADRSRGRGLVGW